MKYTYIVARGTNHDAPFMVLGEDLDFARTVMRAIIADAWKDENGIPKATFEPFDYAVREEYCEYKGQRRWSETWGVYQNWTLIRLPVVDNPASLEEFQTAIKERLKHDDYKKTSLEGKLW